MAKKTVFVSFDYENDRRYKYLMEAWDAHSGFEFYFSDRSSGEINSWNIPTIKAALTRKIKSARYTFVIVGKEANKLHKYWREIGHRNWINFEIYQSKLNNNKLVAIKLDARYESPEELLGSGAVWARSFTKDSILRALNSI